MLGNVLNKIFSSKVFILVFSLLLSAALWIYVEISENQTVPHQVTGVQVVPLNKDMLSDRNLLIRSMQPETVTLSFQCPRSATSKLTNSALSVSIDLANVTASGPTTLSYVVNYPEGIDQATKDSISRSVNRITLIIDRQLSRQVQVLAPYSGGAAEGFICYEPDFSPRDITVSGPSEYVSKVAKATVAIQRESLTTTYDGDLPFVLLDEDGEELSADILDQLTFSEENIHVTIPVRATKALPLRVEQIFGFGANPENTFYTIEPQTITVAGDPEALRDYNSITIGTIDWQGMSQLSDTASFTIDLENNVTNISGETSAIVTMEIRGLETKWLTVLSTSIHYINEPSGSLVDIRTQSMDVRVRGTHEDLANISETNIRIVVDLAEYSFGNHRIQPRIYVDGFSSDDVGAIGSNYYVSLNIQRE